MRKNLAIFQASPRRLLTLLLITLLVASGVSRRDSSCRRYSEIRKLSREDLRRVKARIDSCSKTPYGIPKIYQLQNIRSRRFIQIMPTAKSRRLYARGNSNHYETQLEYYTYTCPGFSEPLLRIKGKNGKSLCFSRKGSLVQKEDQSNSFRCAFIERSGTEAGQESRITLEAAFNPSFTVAFNRRGQRLASGRYTGVCNYFAKRLVTSADQFKYYSYRPRQGTTAVQKTNPFFNRDSWKRPVHKRRHWKARKGRRGRRRCGKSKKREWPIKICDRNDRLKRRQKPRAESPRGRSSKGDDFGGVRHV